MRRYMDNALTILIRVALVVVALKLLVWWLEPRIAFYPLAGVQETPETFRIPYQDVRIATADGETLHGWWLEREEPHAQVVFWHGNGGNLSLWLDVIAALHREGFSVLAVDYRGYGASTGRASEQGLYKDVEATIRFFADRLRRQGPPTIYWGRSIGCPVAARGIASATPDAVILETPMPDVRTVLRGNPVMWLLSFLSSYRFPTSEHLTGYRGPLLVIHGEADSIVPFAAGRLVFARAETPRKTFVAIPGAGHNDLHVVNADLYWKRIHEFVGSLK